MNKQDGRTDNEVKKLRQREAQTLKSKEQTGGGGNRDNKVKRINRGGRTDIKSN